MSALDIRAANIPTNSDLLRGLKREEVEMVLSAARTRRVPIGSVMTRQGEPANHIMMLWKGRARFFCETPNGKKLILMWITPGHSLGGAALATEPRNYLLSTETVHDSVLLVWDGPTIRGLSRRIPRILENAVLAAVDHVTWYIAAHSALCSKTAPERLAGILVGYTSSMGHKVSGGTEFDITNEELAHAANITPYTTSRILSEWQKVGAVRKERGRIIVRSPEVLFRRVA